MLLLLLLSALFLSPLTVANDKGSPSSPPIDEGTFASSSIADISAQFKKFAATNFPCLTDKDVYAYRQAIFIENYRAIEAHNSCQTHTYKLGLTPFAAYTQDEFSKLILVRNFAQQTFNDIDEDILDYEFKTAQDLELFTCPVFQLPSSWNWVPKGAVTPVKNQGQCGSCWAFSTTGMLEGVNFLRGKPLTSFSEQQLVDCCGKKGYLCQGCNGAWPIWAVNYVQKYGILKSSQYPYVGVEGACKVSTPSGFFVNQKSYVAPNSFALKKAIYRQPVSVAVHASNWSLYSSGVFNNCQSGKNYANHAVTAVGYNANNQWIIKNSWGTAWGASGYMTLAAGNTCGIQNFALVAKI